MLVCQNDYSTSMGTEISEERRFFAIVRRRDKRVVALHETLEDAAVANVRISSKGEDHHVRGAKVVIISVDETFNPQSV